jgi:iron complex transport system permease protein
VSSKNKILFFSLFLLLPIVAVAHLFVGEITLSFSDFYNSLFKFNSSNTNHIIFQEFRIPRLVMGIIAGSGLSIAGLLMQTMFNNPLAGPYILGINSGSSLFVAFSIMTGIPFLTSDIGTISSALIGAFIFGLIILSFSFVVRSHVSLLLIGIMLGSFTSAFVSILQSMSDPSQLKLFTMWAMGSLQQVEMSQLPLIISFFVVGIIASLFVIKPLNALVLGENQALMLGIHIKYVRLILIVITAILTGLITAFCGPIAFVGLAVPNLVKLVFKTQSHGILLLGCLLIGSVFLLLCDILVQLLENTVHIPINALTSIIGAPFVIVIVLKRLA